MTCLKNIKPAGNSRRLQREKKEERNTILEMTYAQSDATTCIMFSLTTKPAAAV